MTGFNCITFILGFKYTAGFAIEGAANDELLVDEFDGIEEVDFIEEDEVDGIEEGEVDGIEEGEVDGIEEGGVNTNLDMNGSELDSNDGVE
jgi:hypothetical protein